MAVQDPHVDHHDPLAWTLAPTCANSKVDLASPKCKAGAFLDELIKPRPQSRKHADNACQELAEVLSKACQRFRSQAYELVV